MKQNKNNKRDRNTTPPKGSTFLRKLIRSAVYKTAIVPDPDEIRDQWVRQQLSKLATGQSIIDVGAGELRYKSSCGHLEYVSQDFGKYTSENDRIGIPTGQFNAKKVDIISDIIDIPVGKASFDHVVCSEVFEHIPDPFAALNEIARIQKKDGIFILTAPFVSMTHLHPYHFFSGFSPEFYKSNLPKYGYKILSIEKNGNYFSWLALELLRAPVVVLGYKKIVFLLIMPAFLIALPFIIALRVCGSLFPQSSEISNGGIFIVAKKTT